MSYTAEQKAERIEAYVASWKSGEVPYRAGEEHGAYFESLLYLSDRWLALVKVDLDEEELADCSEGIDIEFLVDRDGTLAWFLLQTQICGQSSDVLFAAGPFFELEAMSQVCAELISSWDDATFLDPIDESANAFATQLGAWCG